MAKIYSVLLLLALFFILFTISSGLNTSTSVKTFTLVNNCKETIWPGIITKGDSSHGDGFALKQGQTAFYNAPPGWSGRIWARTACNFDQNGNGTCQTGSCATSLNCTGPSTPPNTIAEFTLGDVVDFYDVSLVDGFNLPITVSPLQQKGNCSTAGCDGDLRQNCSSDLAVKSDGKVIACRSACDAFSTDEYCCRGAYADPMICLPAYRAIFRLCNSSGLSGHVAPQGSFVGLEEMSNIVQQI